MKGLVAAAVVLIAGVASAAQFGAWETGVLVGEGFYAATRTSATDVLGQICYTQDELAGSCFWFIAGESACLLDAKYPVLVNAPSGSSSQELLCRGEKDGTYRHFFTNFDRIDNIIKQSSAGYIGFASALKSGRFDVLRFNLTGAAEAIRAMNQQAEAARRTSPARLPSRERL